MTDKLSLSEARKRHEDLATRCNLTPDEIEEAWLLVIETKDIVNPTPEQERKIVRLGYIFNQAMKR